MGHAKALVGALVKEAKEENYALKTALFIL
jgi:hypothetical protein